MDVSLKSRQKCKAEEIGAGQCFREIQKTRCLLVVDLTQVDMFCAPKTLENGEDRALRGDVVYVVDIDTGVVDIVPKSQEVYRVTMKAQEID